MIKLENYEVMGWEHAIRGMRNPMNSWEKSDSCTQGSVWCGEFCPVINCPRDGTGLRIGPNDLDLMTRLRNAGTDHRKFMRMITVYVDITAPLYWWKEFDTYKVGTTANSCSTMHKIHEKEFTLGDFSCEKLHNIRNHDLWANWGNHPDGSYRFGNLDLLKLLIVVLNDCRERYNISKDKAEWEQMIQLLPSSYNQKRTVMLNYEVLANIYKSRKAHKLQEWLDFCEWIKTLPYSELITGNIGNIGNGEAGDGGKDEN